MAKVTTVSNDDSSEIVKKEPNEFGKFPMCFAGNSNAEAHEREFHDTLGAEKNSMKKIYICKVATVSNNDSSEVVKEEPNEFGKFPMFFAGNSNGEAHEREFRDTLGAEKNSMKIYICKVATVSNNHSSEVFKEEPNEFGKFPKCFADNSNEEAYEREFHDTLGAEKNSKDKIYKCEVCGLEYSERQQFLKHLLDHSKKFVCEECGKCFGTRCNLIRHLRIHTKERSFVCNICGKSFVQKSHLKSHLHIHTKEKPYPCEICGKAFTERGYLKCHLRIHTEEKPYVCEICSKAFARTFQLNSHLQTHSENKPYACDICSKAFFHRGSLKSHLRVHKNEKPYACDVCSRAYSQKRSLEAHLRAHKKEKPYACHFCSKAFTQKHNLTKHMLTHTN